MLRWLNAHGARLRAADSRGEPPGLTEAGRYVVAGQIFCGSLMTYAQRRRFNRDQPGVSMRDAIVVQAITRAIPVVGDIELFAQMLPEIIVHALLRLPVRTARLLSPAW